MLVEQTHSELKDLEIIAAQALDLAKQRGAAQAEVHLSKEEGFSTTVRNSDVETLEHTREKSLSISVYFQQRCGTATTSDLSKAAILATVEKACSIARYTSEDPYTGLADSALMATHFPDLELYYPWDITPAEAIHLSIQCEQKARSIDSRITQVDAVNFNKHQGIYVYANSHGFLNGFPVSDYMMSCSLIASDGSEMHRDYDYSLARKGLYLDSPEALAERAAQKVLSRLGATQLKTTRCPVIFQSQLARGLLGQFIRAISGGNLYRKSSFLLDHLNKPVFPSFVNIVQKPHLLGGWGSANYDNDGVFTRDLDYIKNGVLESYALGNYSARKLGLVSTGNADGVHNLSINHSGLDFKALLKQMDRGLLVTELMGQGVNILTGDYSRGAFGYWVENGEIQHPVEEITIAGNLKELFAHLVAVGSDVDTRANIQTGSILLNEMTIAGA